MRKKRPNAPFCPVHEYVQMVRIREPRRGFKFDKYSHLKKATIEKLRASHRYKCPVEGCYRVAVVEPEVPEPPVVSPQMPAGMKRRLNAYPNLSVGKRWPKSD
jgi:hypothetical protein